MFNNLRIAVVGNSPSESGLGKGPEIDNHDVVIRFNNYVLSEQFNKDYGTKTDCWCSNGFPDVMLRGETYKSVFITTPALDVKYLKIHNVDHALPCYENLHTLIKQYVDNIYFIPFDVYKIDLSAGLNMLLWLKSMNIDMKLVDVYGFNFFDSTKRHHYFHGKSCGTNDHNGEKEREAYKAIKGE